MSAPIQLIVGLGNPGADYGKTRHNAGAWFVQNLAEQAGERFKAAPKAKGMTCVVREGANECRLLIPTTFMNCSGATVAAVAKFYKIPPEAILVAHDELDFPPGTVRLKQDGGHGGHNGLRDIINHLHSKAFYRLRIGIGHPGHRDQVHDYVLHRPSRHDQTLIIQAIEAAMTLLPDLLTGALEQATQRLHSE